MNPVRTVLTTRFFAFYGLLQLVAVVGVLFPAMMWAAIFFSTLLLAIAWLDYGKLASPHDFKIHSPKLSAMQLEQRLELPIKVEFCSSRAKHAARLTLVAPPVPILRFRDMSLSIQGPFEDRITKKKMTTREIPEKKVAKSAIAKKGFAKDNLTKQNLIKEESTNSYLIVVFNVTVFRLGFTSLSAWPVHIESPLALFRREFPLAIEPIELRAAPEQVKLPEQAFQQLIQTQKVLYLGSRLRARARSADQFHSIRPYQYPDPLRWIDHKKTARYGEPMTRVFDSYFSHHLILIFDLGRSMLGQIGNSAKSDYYVSAALALAENAIASRDRVSLITIGELAKTQIRSSKSLASFAGLLRGNLTFNPRAEETNYSRLSDAISGVTGSRSIVVILTDTSKPNTQAALLESCGLICRKHLTVVLSLIDRDVDLDNRVLSIEPQRLMKLPLLEFKNWYSDLLYSYWIRERQTVFRDNFARAGGGSLAVNDRDWMACVNRLYLLLRESSLA